MTSALIMTKLVVADLEAASAFYGAVCGVVSVQRIEDDSFAEIIMKAEPGAGALVLITYKNQPAPVAGECVLVFETGDVAQFVERAVAAGGSVTQPATRIAALNLTYALVKDPEGHIVEAINRG